MSVREYLARVRVAKAITPIVNGERIDPISLEMGYGSRKNFNAAFARVLGLPPSALRALPFSETRTLRERLETELKGRFTGPARRPDRASGHESGALWCEPSMPRSHAPRPGHPRWPSGSVFHRRVD